MKKDRVKKGLGVVYLRDKMSIEVFAYKTNYVQIANHSGSVNTHARQTNSTHSCCVPFARSHNNVGLLTQPAKVLQNSQALDTRRSL